MKKIYLIALLTGIPMSLSGVFIPLLAQELGASFWDIGLIVALFGLANMISSYFFGRLSDITGNRKFFIAIGILASAAAYFLHIFMGSVLAIYIIRAAAAFTIGIFSFPMIAYISRLDHYRSIMGRYSGLGAFGWFVGQILAAILLSYGYIFILSGVFFLIAFFISRELPDNWETAVVVPRFPLELIRKNLGIYLSLFLRQVGMQAIWPVLTVYMLTLGADKFWIAVIFSINPLCQLFSMEFAGRISSRREPLIIRTGLFFALLGALSLLFVTHFLWVIVTMVLISIAWGFLWVGSLVYLTERNPEKSTSTGVLGSFSSLALATGPALGGAIAQLWGVHALFAYSALMCIAALGASALIRNK